MNAKEELKAWPRVACYRDAVEGCGMWLPWTDFQIPALQSGCKSRTGEDRHCQLWTRALAFSSCLPSLGAQRPSEGGLEKS